MLEYGFIFILMGTKPVKRDVENGVRVRQTCRVCGVLSELREVRVRNYFTLFFIPIFPLNRGESVMSCSRCEASFAMPSSARMSDAPLEREMDAPYEVDVEKRVIICESCQGKLRVPVLAGKRLRVTCPHCGAHFDFSMNKL